MFLAVFGADVVDILLMLWMSWRDDGMMLHLVMKILQPAEVHKRSILGISLHWGYIYIYILEVVNKMVKSLIVK